MDLVKTDDFNCRIFGCDAYITKSNVKVVYISSTCCTCQSASVILTLISGHHRLDRRKINMKC